MPETPIEARSIWSQILSGLWYGTAIGAAFVLSTIIDELWL